MATNSSIQPQWDLAQTTRESSLLVREVIRACSVDDVQYQAVLAFETLGKELLIHPDRIDDSIEALGGSDSVRLGHLKILIGLSSDGLAKQMRNSVGCISAFALVTACKTCYSDNSIATILKQLMVHRGVINKTPASTQQMLRLLEAVSPHCDQLIPTSEFAMLANKTMVLLSDSSRMPGLLSELSPEAGADLLHRVFDAIRDHDVDFITLEGRSGGIWLATVLLWLHKDEVQIRLGGTVLIGSPSCRVTVHFSNNYSNNWSQKLWRRQSEIISLIEMTDGTMQHQRSHELFPLQSARTVLSNEYQLNRKEEDLCGKLTNALVKVAIEKGSIATELKPLMPLALADVCSETCLETYDRVAESYGWNCDDEFKKGSDRIATAISIFVAEEDQSSMRTMERECQGDYMVMLRKILACMEARNRNAGRQLCFPSHDIETSWIIEPAVNLAAEAIYLSLYEPGRKAPIRRFMTGYHWMQSTRNAARVCHIVFGTFLVSIHDLRRELFNSLLSNSDKRRVVGTEMALARAKNGYVVYQQCLQAVSLSPRACVAVCATPGNIRAESGRELYDSIYQVDESESFFPRAGVTSHEPVRAFHRGIYQGLEPRGDPYNYKVQHQISTIGRELHVMTFLQSDVAEEGFVLLDWIKSIEATAAAHRMETSRSLSGLAEQRKATIYQEANALDNISWVGAGQEGDSESHRGLITLTDGDDVLRFFAAGKFNDCNLLIRGRATLMSCIDRLLSSEGTDESVKWVIIA